MQAAAFDPSWFIGQDDDEEEEEETAGPTEEEIKKREALRKLVFKPGNRYEPSDDEDEGQDEDEEEEEKEDGDESPQASAPTTVPLGPSTAGGASASSANTTFQTPGAGAFIIGNRVRLHGLTNTKMNDKIACINGFVPSSGRWEVTIDDDGSTVRIKEENLEVIAEVEETQSVAASFMTGNHVRLRGLSNAAMNAKTARISGFVRASGRWQVTMDDGGAVLAIKEENLEVIAEVEETQNEDQEVVAEIQETQDEHMEVTAEVEETQACFMVGSRVRLCGLIERPEMNGKEAEIIGFSGTSGRWKITIDGGATFSMKEDNLMLRTAQTDAEAAEEEERKRKKKEKKERKLKEQEMNGDDACDEKKTAWLIPRHEEVPKTPPVMIWELDTKVERPDLRINFSIVYEIVSMDLERPNITPSEVIQKWEDEWGKNNHVSRLRFGIQPDREGGGKVRFLNQYDDFLPCHPAVVKLDGIGSILSMVAARLRPKDAEKLAARRKAEKQRKPFREVTPLVRQGLASRRGVGPSSFGERRV